MRIYKDAARILPAFTGDGTRFEGVPTGGIAGNAESRKGQMAETVGSGNCTVSAASFAADHELLVRWFRSFVRNFEYGNNSPSRGV
jgi:hypothetical protein